MKLQYVALSGFRGYRKDLRIDFSEAFTIIDGRNGTGKSTIFDAIEFALTGRIGKYGDAKADRQSVEDYVWWNGGGSDPAERYVEVGFADAAGTIILRRTPFSTPSIADIEGVVARLCEADSAPAEPLKQLCAASILRDEHIAALSLDLKETERYSLVSSAIGAADADDWIARAARILSLARNRVTAARTEVDAAAAQVSVYSRRIDEIRGSLAQEELVAKATKRLQAFTDSSLQLDELRHLAREALVTRMKQVEVLRGLQGDWPQIRELEAQLPALREAAQNAERSHVELALSIHEFSDQDDAESEETLTTLVREVAELITLGKRIGRLEGRCPLCATPHDPMSFEQGLERSAAEINRLNQFVLAKAEQQRVLAERRAAIMRAQEILMGAREAVQQGEGRVRSFYEKLATAGITKEPSIEALAFHITGLETKNDDVREDLRILETVGLSATLERAVQTVATAKDAHIRAEQRLGAARRAEHRAQVLHDAARRAAGETLNQRLDRVLPLMAELYRRLRPHPTWTDIEYKVRGDVKRFLKLQVGDDLNPQFIFSSGQRRATGLAFLLSVNLSLSWSRWRTVLLDDPVQHIDDFRSVHLAEVLARVAASGRQIICAVEDSALADLICRRIPQSNSYNGRRVTLGPNSEGDLAKSVDELVAPIAHRAVLPLAQAQAG